MKYIVITSINDITDAVIAFSKRKDWHVVVVADTKSIPYNYNNITYLTVEEQANLGYESLKSTPYNHYSRKNLGYLYAIQNGAARIYDTDDDTFPYENWEDKQFICNSLAGGSKFINPYKFFTEQKVWPRGLDLSHINRDDQYVREQQATNVGVWQGVIDGDSDFDAIYRLTVDEHVKFTQEEDVAIANSFYAPFNTQSTLWNPIFYSLLYIPVTVDFRFTDILRGYIAQRIMWEYGHTLGFHGPNTYQIRNAHDYFKDFLGELSMYRQVPEVIQMLDSLELRGVSIEEDLVTVYNSLQSIGVVQQSELVNLQNWIYDLSCNSVKK